MTIHEYNEKRAGALRAGYTTGTCAACAAVAAFLAINGEETHAVNIMTPAGVELDIPVEELEISESSAFAAVRKYSGDDPDITDGMLIYVRAEIEESEYFSISIRAGEGIGIVRRDGLEQPAGEPAINSVPRRMIAENIERIAAEKDIHGRLILTVYAPEGEERAKKTFNPRLGIEGGISVLGTSGIVKPMSREAFADTIRLNMRQQLMASDTVIAVPGRYGTDFLKRSYGIEADRLVEFGNFAGEMIDSAAELGASKLIIAGHIGKLIKLAGGIMNTHSNEADCRAEIMAAGILRLKDRLDMKPDDILSTSGRVLNSVTTEEMVDILYGSNIAEPVMGSLCELIGEAVKRRAAKACSMLAKRRRDGSEYSVPEIEIISFTLKHGELMRSGF